MALIKCKECKHEVSKKAKICPNCGAPVKQETSFLGQLFSGLLMIIVFFVFFDYFGGTFDNSGSGASKPKSYPTSNAQYNEINSQVGCKSKYSDDKKDDIFRSNYKNHWMTWTGVVVLAEADNASLNIDNFGTQDLIVYFADKEAGYHLTKDSRITVKFLMSSAGGCFLPFSGKNAVILK